MINILIGALTGIISGLGVGGGTVLMMLLSLLGYEHFDAVGINLTYFVACAFPVTVVHIKNKTVSVKEVLPICIVACITSVAVTLLVINLEETVLRKIFGIFVILTGIKELIFSKKKD